MICSLLVYKSEENSDVETQDHDAGFNVRVAFEAVKGERTDAGADPKVCFHGKAKLPKVALGRRTSVCDEIDMRNE